MSEPSASWSVGAGARDARIGAGAPPEQPTQALDRLAAGAVADPGARTEVLVRPAGAGLATGSDPGVGGPGSPEQETAGPAAAPPPLLTRRQAAEAGMYAGAGLVALAVGGTIARGWAGWEAPMRAAAVGLSAIALVAAGLFVRLPWTRRAGDERRRAVSTMLTAGAALGLVSSAVALDVRQGVPGASAVVHAVLSVVVMLGVCLVARAPVAELGLLAAGAWSVWLLVPPGPVLWAALVGLGALWAGVGARWARGRRTAAVSGCALALLASIGLAQGAWAWPVRGGVAAVAALGLVRFLRGGGNAWLALGAGSATALAASVAGARLGPALALLVGGLATMGVSGVALRSARRSG